MDKIDDNQFVLIEKYCSEIEQLEKEIKPLISQQCEVNAKLYPLYNKRDFLLLKLSQILFSPISEEELESIKKDSKFQAIIERIRSNG